MKWLFNARTAAAALAFGAMAAFVPSTGVAQTIVNATWTQVPGQGPSMRTGASMAYDSVRQRSVLFGGNDFVNYLADTWQFDGTTWTQLQVAGPTGRYLSPMVFDSARGVAVLTGGVGFGGIQTDTWEWNGSSWNQKLTLHSPPTRLWTAATYDSFRHVTVLFGGASQTGFFNDTWEYDGNDWAQVITAHSPTARRGMGLAFDSARGRTVLFGGQNASFLDLNDTWEFDGADWTQVAIAASPTARLWHSMAYDPNLGGVVMLGGSSGNNLNAPLADTWLYDGVAWQQIAANGPWTNRMWASVNYESARGDVLMFGGSDTPLAAGGHIFNDTWSLTGVTTSPPDWGQVNPSPAPSARVFAQMDYDSARGVSVLFGGSSDAGPGNLHDTWEWDGARWAQMAPVNSPPAVAGATMAYDSARGVSVLFGGSGTAGPSSQTWEWDGANWTQNNTAASPPARVWPAMTYDSVRNRTVLFGGDGQNGVLGDTWLYDGINWTQMNPASSPTPREGPAMAFDPARGRTVMFGGRDTNGRLADTWEWDGANWARIPTSTAPPPRFWASLAFDTQRGKTVLFGGDHILPYVLGESNDTWEWDGAQWTPDWTRTAPTIRAGQAMAYDSVRGRMVVFAGWNAATSPATFYGDTWELGSGIQTPAGTPAGSLQQLGNLNFGSVFVGSNSQASLSNAAFSLTNTGTGPLTVNSITVTGSDFPMTNYCPTGGNPLAAGSSCMTLFVFAPSAAGSRTATVTFDFGAPGGPQTFQLQGTGVLNPTTLNSFGGVGLFKGTTTLVASLASNGSALAGQPVTFTLPNGASATIQTNSLGIAVWSGASLTGMHAGSYPTGAQASFAGTQTYASSSASGALVVSQPVTTTYTGEFYVGDTTAGHVAARVDQRTPASDPQFIDYATTAVWARFTVAGPASSFDAYGPLTDATNWSTTGLGTATATLPAFADGAYTVVVTLVYGPSENSLNSAVSSDDTRTGLVSSPTKGAFLSGGGAIATDPSANTSDRHGYFSFQMKPGKPPVGNLVYSYRVRMDVGGGNMRDVDVWVTSTSITTLNGDSATGKFAVQYVDAQTGQRYSGFEFTGGTFKLTLVDGNNAKIGLVLKRADGTVFHTTGGAPVPVVLGRVVNKL